MKAVSYQLQHDSDSHEEYGTHEDSEEDPASSPEDSEEDAANSPGDMTFPDEMYHQGCQQRPIVVEDWKAKEPMIEQQAVPMAGHEVGPDYIPLNPTKPKSIPDLVLCEEQENLVQTIISGRNVFYTGSAGCGKSTVLRSFVRRLRDLGKQVDIVAPTGKAALNVHGSTFWSYAGWTPDTMKKPMTEVIAACHKKQTWKRLNKTDALVIDEISMMENFYLERLNRIMKEARIQGRKPFGGVQIIVCGDFCQLPPVQPMKFCIECGEELRLISGDAKRCSRHGVFSLNDQWAFKSAAWRECNFDHVNLKTIHRQKDATFISILEKIRLGKSPTSKERQLLENHPSKTDGAVKLFSKKEDVRKMNERNFNRLRTPIMEYQCYDHFEMNAHHRDLGHMTRRDPDDKSLLALSEHRLERKTELREGMLVILLANLDIRGGLVNGSQGVIIGFDPRPTIDQLSDSTGEHASLRQSLIRKFVEDNESWQWPIVRFLNGREQTIFPNCTINEIGPNAPWSLISRTQVPLMAAWAMTIHKAQGMTLERVIVDLKDTFEKGHDYVALSRATGLEGLKVENLGLLNKGLNQQVREFLKEHFGVT